MCPHATAAYVSSYYCYVCVLILLRCMRLQKPLRALPGFAMQLVQAAVSLKRLREFLAAQDLAVVQQAEKLGIVA